MSRDFPIKFKNCMGSCMISDSNAFSFFLQMKSFHRNMIRAPKFAEVYRYGVQDTVVKANMKTNHVTVEMKPGSKQKTLKLKGKKHKRKIKCCV